MSNGWFDRHFHAKGQAAKNVTSRKACVVVVMKSGLNGAYIRTYYGGFDPNYVSIL